jgi:hypothetical protein
MPDLMRSPTRDAPLGLFCQDPPPGPPDHPAAPAGNPGASRTQPLVMADPNPEIEIGRAVLEALDQRYESLLDWLRVRMRRLYLDRLRAQGRELAYVSSDDARLVLDSDPHVPPTSRLCRNFMGSLFRGDDSWEFTGRFTNSSVPGSHGNLIRCWRLKERTP